MPEDLQQLLDLQTRDSAIDALRYKRERLPERARLTACLDEAKALLPQQQRLRAERDAEVREEQRLEDEIAKVRAKITDDDAKLYSGTVTSPRELQSLQDDLAQLRRHVSKLEDDELEHMAAREGLDAQLAPVDERLRDLRREVDELQRAIAAAESAIDADIVSEEQTRAGEATRLPASLVADYEARRRRNRGTGAARLVGDTCQACRLTIPATEVDQIRHDDGGRIWYCDNCGAILVAS